MGLLAWIVVGLIAGYLASTVMKGRGSGVVNDIILGVIGAVLGGYLASVLLNMPDAVNGINTTSIVVAFVGAVIFIVLLRAIAPRRGVWRR
jgi:uncharacterized membrane protein YeaQ/YmgE (transglycosylase-associated protein family)